MESIEPLTQLTGQSREESAKALADKGEIFSEDANPIQIPQAQFGRAGN